MIKEAIETLKQTKDLSPSQMQRTMEGILTGKTQTADIATFLSLLSDKGETVGEIVAAVNVLLKYVDKIEVDEQNILDTCGTGGDKKGTFNISTASALVASGAGIMVAKHGNRSVSSRCGSADVLEALGVNINMDKSRIKKCLEEIGIAFLFAPALHPAMKYVMPARKELGRKTIFNILGPLINPVRSRHHLLGVYSAQWVEILARVLSDLGAKHVLVVYGKDGLDEVTTADKTVVCEAREKKLHKYEIAPEDLGIKRACLRDLLGGSLEENKQIILDIFLGKKGPQRDIVLLNSACAIYAADKAPTIKEGLNMAVDSIDSGKALKKLELLKTYSHG